MSNTLIALLVLAVGAVVLVIRSKANFGKVLADFFSEKKVLLLEMIAFLLVPLHAHIAAELGVKLTNGIYGHRFLVHFTLEFIPFAIGMALYKNGRDLMEAFSKSVTVVVKEALEVVLLVALTAGGLWLSLYQMSVGFGKPYMAFLKSRTGEDVSFAEAFMSLTDFSLSTSYVIIMAHALVFAALLVMGFTSAFSSSSKSSTTKPKSGGLFGAIADLFGAKPKPAQTQSDNLHIRAAKIIGSGSPGLVKQSIEDQRLTSQVKSLCDRYDTAASQMEKAHIANELRDLL